MLMNDVAQLLQEYEIPEQERIILLAIAAAESALDPLAKGDNLSNYHGYFHQLYAPYASGGYLAFGLFQIFTYWHRDRLLHATKDTDPDAWAVWLMQPANNVAMAVDIYLNQGLSAWSAYKAETYKPFMPAATLATRSLPPFEPDPPAALDEGEPQTLVRTLRHIADRLELHFGLRPYP